MDEIDAAAFTPEEVLTLEERWQRARNGTRLQEQVFQNACHAGGNGRARPGFPVEGTDPAAHELERMDASTAAWLAPLAEVNLELKEIEGRLADYSSELDCDPRELFQLEERINLLESLKMKYGPSFEDVCARREEAAHRLDRIEHRTERLEELRPPWPFCASRWTPRAGPDQSAPGLRSQAGLLHRQALPGTGLPPGRL